MPDFNQHIDIIPADAFESLFTDKPAETKVENASDDKKQPSAPSTVGIPVISEEELTKLEEAPTTENKQDDEKEEQKNEDKEKTVDPEVSTILKNTVEFMVSQGLWKDFEGRDTMEFDNETYASLALEQNQRQVNEMVDEVLNSTGEYGKAIITHIRQGGNADEIIDIFKEHKRVELLGNTETIDGKKQFVTEYYKKFNNWSEAKAERYVNSLIEDESLDAEVEEVKENYKSIQEEELAEIRTQQEALEKEKEKRREETKQNITKAIDDNEDLTKEEKKSLKNSLFKFNKKLSDGSVVSDFYQKFATFQEDPKKYAELVHFIVDNEGFKKKLQQKGGVQVKQEKWNFVKDNGAINKKGNAVTERPDNRKPENAYKGTNFKFI